MFKAAITEPPHLSSGCSLISDSAVVGRYRGQCVVGRVYKVRGREI